MPERWSNIEPIARELCECALRRAGTSEAELPDAVNRYWHCVAARLEAGIIDDQGNRVLPFDFNRDLEAYHDWRRRHPTYRVPGLTALMQHHR
jgi:hypothetical protein